MDPVEERVKKIIVTAARETWEIYFSRLFPASVREHTNSPDCSRVSLWNKSLYHKNLHGVITWSLKNTLEEEFLNQLCVDLHCKFFKL